MPSPLILSVLRELSKTTPTQPSDSCNDYEKNPLVEVYVNKHYMGITQLDTAQTLYRTAINPNYLFENDDHTAFSRNSKGLVQYTLVDLESLREAVQLNESYEDYEDLDEDYEDLDEDYEDLTEEQLAEIAETITEEEFEHLDELSNAKMRKYKRSAWLSGKIFGTAAKELRDVAKYTARETGQEARRNGRSPEKLQQDAELIQGIKASSRTMQAKADKRKEGRERASRLMKRK